MPVCDNKYHIQHNPLDTRQQDPWHSLQGSGNPLEPKHLSEFDKLDVTKQFHENVSRILIPRDMAYHDCLLLDLFANPMVCVVYMLHGALVLWCLGCLSTWMADLLSTSSGDRHVVS